MDAQAVQAIAAGVASGLGGVGIVALWLRKAFHGLDEIPGLLKDVAALRRDLEADIKESSRVAVAAHTRIDGHTERIARLEASTAAHDHASERGQAEIDRRLARIETKLDAVIMARPACGMPDCPVSGK